jgi:Fe2+ or Zn2+ uptake regulation protein
MRMRINNNRIYSRKERLSTPQRRLLLDTLREAKGHLDARELYRRAVEKDLRISLATVYRNLQLFKELGIVEERRLDEVHCYYEIKGATEHYHMVCTACGRVMEFESPLVGDLVAEVQRNSDFEVTRAVLYLEGYCPECKGKGKAS